MRPRSPVSLFPEDELLRNRGFSIVSRPPGGQAVWVRDRREYLQVDALKKANAEKNAQLERLTEAFSQG